jgi:hypothetical protein
VRKRKKKEDETVYFWCVKPILQQALYMIGYIAFYIGVDQGRHRDES